MNLNDTLITIAKDWDVIAHELTGYAYEDLIGGYHSDPLLSAWPTGSLWAAEGMILYALVRALRPARVVEFGSWKGCSGSHLAAALQANGYGELVCVDPYPPAVEWFAPELRGVITIVGATAEHWLTDNDLADYGLCFEDTYHSRETVAAVWTAARQSMPAGGVVISHDALHETSWQEVQAGMSDGVGDEWRAYLIAPADCGLGMYRKGKT